ncbi:MAG: cytochrome P450 [Acetobacteraceae bacterium]
MADPAPGRRLPPGPKPLPIIGNLLDFARQGPDLFENSARRFGDITTIYLGNRKHFIVNDPALIQQILVRDRQNFVKGRALRLAGETLGTGLLTSDGETYRKQRRVAQPAFNIKNMAEFGDSVAFYLDRLNQRWVDGQRFDLMQEMTELCINIAAKTFLGVELSTEAHVIGEVFEATLASLNTLNLLPPVAERLPLPLNRKLKHLRRKLSAIAEGIIQQRRSDPGRATDLLSLVLAQAEADAEGFSEQEIRDQIITFLFAGYEAPCKALFWTWYLLARDRQGGGSVEDRMLTELDAVLGGRAPMLQDVANLRYTRGVVSESLRLYPPAWIIARKILNPYEAGGYTLPAGSEIFLSPYITQRDARFFPDPLTFDPARWLEPAETRPPFAFYPFGGGLRGCSGVHFAWPEMILVVASIAQRWRIEIDTGAQVEPNPAFTFGPRKAVLATVRARASAV